MGTKGETGLQRLVLGSNTAYVIQHCSLPILAIPADAVPDVPRNILFASEDLIVEDQVVSVLKTLVDNWNSKLFLLQVLSLESKVDGGNVESIGGIPCTYLPRKHGDIIECIDEEIKTNDIGMAVVMAKHHGFLYHIMNRSVSQRLALHSNIPLLVLRG